MEKFNKVKEGSTVKVVVSKGQEKATVPNVKGKGKEDAIKLLEDSKLKAEIIEENSKTVKEGFVVSQETDPDTEVFAGDVVKIHVSKGIEKAEVPEVIGKTEAEAKEILEENGFIVIIVPQEDSSKENGVILKQGIDAGKTVEKGSSITITVNSFEASKSITVSMNIKAITGGYTEEKVSTENTNKAEDDNNTANTQNTSNTSSSKEKIAKTVSITLKSGNTTVYSDSGVDKNTTNKTTTISGKGSADLTLTITDSNNGSWTRTKTVNFSNETSVNFE